MQTMYYTGTNISTPLIGAAVAERKLSRETPGNKGYAYRNLTQGDSSYPITSFIAGDVKTNSLEIDILTLGRSHLEKVFDKMGGQRLQVIPNTIRTTATSNNVERFDRGVQRTSVAGRSK